MTHLVNVIQVFFNGNAKPYYFKNEVKGLQYGDVVEVQTKHGKALTRFEQYLPIEKFQPGHPTMNSIRKIEGMVDTKKQLNDIN